MNLPISNGRFTPSLFLPFINPTQAGREPTYAAPGLFAPQAQRSALCLQIIWLTNIIYFCLLLGSPIVLLSDSMIIAFAEQRSTTCAKEFPPEVLAYGSMTTPCNVTF